MGEGAGIITLVALLVASPFMMWAARVERFKRRLTPVEQNLERASGIALPVVIVAGAVLFFGSSAPEDFVRAVVADPATMWPPAVFLAAVLVCCLVRFRAGVRRLAGYQDDGLLALPALVKLGVSLVVIIWLGRFYPWPGATGWVFFAVRLVFLVAVLAAVVGATRYWLVTRRVSAAVVMVQESIDANEFQWEPARRRRWWQFWKR